MLCHYLRGHSVDCALAFRMKIQIRSRLESTDEGWVRDKALELYGVETIKVGHSGWPDRWYLIPGGRPFIIEHKRETGTKAMPRQAWRVKRLRDWGYDVEIIDDRHQALEAVRRKVDAARVSAKGSTPSRRKRGAGTPS